MKRRQTIDIAKEIVEDGQAGRLRQLAEAVIEAESAIRLSDEIFKSNKVYIAEIVTSGWLEQHGATDE